MFVVTSLTVFWTSPGVNTIKETPVQQKGAVELTVNWIWGGCRTLSSKGFSFCTCEA